MVREKEKGRKMEGNMKEVKERKEVKEKERKGTGKGERKERKKFFPSSFLRVIFALTEPINPSQGPLAFNMTANEDQIIFHS